MKLSLSVKLVAGCSLILLVALSLTFYVINERQERLIIRQAENEARAVFQQIVIMRRWIADHGGVFVERLPWAQTNPYLSNPEIVDSQSRHYSRKTPAMVTKELADYARDEGLYWFHITSLKLTNPENLPDAFERDALLQFEEQALPEIIAMETLEGSTFLRYVSPLYVEEACLACHGEQGYEVGDIRGAISVTLPLSKVFAEAAANKRTLFVAMLLVVATLSAAMTYLLRRQVLSPMNRLSTSMQGFSESREPGGPILRTGDEFEDLSRSFESMADRLNQYHEGLEGKIRAATEELAAANRQLSLASERKSDFLMRAAHELRTPLTSINGAMEYVTAKLGGSGPPLDAEGEELLDFCHIIQKNTHRLIRMVRTMLDIERIEMGAESSLQRSSVDLTQVIQESVTGFTFEAALSRVQLCALPAQLPKIQADEDRIRQVLINLLANAVKFSPEDSTIEVCAALRERFIHVEVCDEGPGIAAQDRDRIFEKFYRAGGKEGCGLGLAICRAIIKAHGGEIGATDGKNGKGACVYFTLPV
ncbi:HAMP domain-containing protein [Geoalkalibacter ferrihydriticus]|uniref:histidine kinase n=2 Tax=Geoalkalibacter ferrihydriticus TaxID=392333 RepID=A0A0C2HZF1_9BACT|nr:ATP-binding protein [Geoalkalibacter ferrihydriticus]KIH78097.1 ATP-binding protein [Geoalkalibacter ferrihydriticus DSM 17813]SDM78195.1 HAMP domain-containing protein [Geoalkalibacter ferrihydriticus]